ncbi:hypothetical protein BGZ54_000854 [Gamsiella multidivaricata]|nr:hypothetical protein BGZ54_000854 [Gamsiella multidivaricata]
MQDRLCGTPGSSSVSMRGIVTGISSFPRTIITKCLLPTGKVRVVSETSTRFSMTSYKLFPNAILKAFREPDELMQAMGSSIRNTTFPNSTFFVDPSFYADSVLLSEVRVRNSTVDVIACNSYSTAFYNVSSIAMTCIYTTVETLFLKPQEINPAITTALRGKPLPMYHNVSLSMAITHIVAKDESGVGPIGISTLQNATASAARYMASLGQNFLEDYDEGVLYVIYDVVDTLAGFDIPDWLMGCMFAAMVFCLCFWALTEYFLDVLYTGSLYRVISARFIPSPTSGTPIIMRSNVKPLTIETIPVLPADDIYPMDVVPSTVSLPQTL